MDSGEPPNLTLEQTATAHGRSRRAAQRERAESSEENAVADSPNVAVVRRLYQARGTRLGPCHVGPETSGIEVTVGEGLRDGDCRAHVVAPVWFRLAQSLHVRAVERV